MVGMLAASARASTNCPCRPSTCCPTRRRPTRCANWQAVATNFDALAFNTTATGQFLPLVRIDNTPQSPQLQTSFGLAAYVGETRTFGETGEPVHEAIASLGAVLGGTLVGVDKTAGPYNWVSMTREYYVNRNGQYIVLNNPFASRVNRPGTTSIPTSCSTALPIVTRARRTCAPILDQIDLRVLRRRQRVDRRRHRAQLQLHGLQLSHATNRCTTASGASPTWAWAWPGCSTPRTGESRTPIPRSRPRISTPSIGPSATTSRRRPIPTTRSCCPSAPTPPPA